MAKADAYIDDDNLVASALVNVRTHFSFVGLTEYYDESMVLLQEKIGLSEIYYARRNESFGPGLLLEDRHLEQVRNLNSLDLILYERLKEAFFSGIEGIGKFGEKVDRFRRRNKQIGWLRYNFARLIYRAREKALQRVRLTESQDADRVSQ